MTSTVSVEISTVLLLIHSQLLHHTRPMGDDVVVI